MLATLLLAVLQLNPIFGDHAVVQRDRTLPVWGTGAKAGERLTLTFAGTNTWTRANRDGTFRFLLPARKAGGPFELTVEAASGERAVAKDVLVGELWLAAGQSNMAFGTGAAEPGFGDVGDDALRCFTSYGSAGLGEMREANGKWVAATPRAVKGFSAAATFFARALRRELGVPVGFFVAAAGATRIEAWSSEAALAQTPAGRAELAKFAAGLADPRLWAGSSERRSEPPPVDAGPTAAALGWTKPSAPTAAWGNVMVPSLFADLEGRDFNGAVWYVRDVTVPPALRGRDLVFKIPGVDKHDRTFVNGTQVGAMGKGAELDYYATERAYPVPAKLIGADGRARLAIRVWSHIYGGGIGTADGAFALEAAKGGGALDLCGFWKWRIERDCGRVGGGTSGFVPGNANAPHALFDSNIAPFATCALRGAIWYQGESNDTNAQLYHDYLAAMVRDWRHRWGQGDFPFIAVQLAGYGTPVEFNVRSPWAEIRQAMLDCSLEDPNFGIASAVDIGDAVEIHPKNKLEVGERLARWALHHVYGRRDVAPTGPRPRAATLADGKVTVTFSDCGKGLVAKGALAGFWLKGADGGFRPAAARIVRPDAVEIAVPEGPAPVEVRYGWSKNPKLTLSCDSGLPASPFRLSCARK